MTRLLAILLLAAQGAAAEPPGRIASFSPAATRILADLGESGRVVAATRWCELPQGDATPRVCDAFQPEIERLAALRPEAVVVPRLANPLLAERLRSAGMRVHVLAPESPDSPAEDIRMLGELVAAENRASELVSARRPLAPPGQRKVLVVWDGVVAGPGSYLAWVITAAGARPAPAKGTWIPWDPEAVAATNPDLVLYLMEGGPAEPRPSPRLVDDWKSRPGLRTTTCASKGYIYEVRPDSRWLPASGLPAAAGALAKLLESSN